MLGTLEKSKVPGPKIDPASEVVESKRIRPIRVIPNIEIAADRRPEVIGINGSKWSPQKPPGDAGECRSTSDNDIAIVEVIYRPH
jgi:hypothetical protein